MLDRIIAKSASEQPDKTAIIVDDRQWSYQQFQRRVESIGGKLAKYLKPKPKIAVLFQLHPFDAWASLIALRRVGVATAATENIAELSSSFFDGALVVASNQSVDAHRFVDLSKLPNGEPSAAQSWGGHYLACSGSTGGRKILRMDPDTEPAVARARATLFSFEETTRFHIGGFGLWTAAGYKFPLAVWSVGGTVVIDRGADFADRFQALEIDHAFMLPDQLDSHAKRRQDGPAAVLRIITSGGFTAAETVATAARKVTERLTNIYTATEVNRTILIADYCGKAQEFAWLTPAPGVELSILDENGEEAQMGELRIKLAPGDCRDYECGDSAGSFADGWLFPGDLAERRADGRYRLLGRADAMIVVGGQKLAASPFEDVLRAMVAADACVFSGQLRSGRDCVVVALETKDFTEKDIKSALVGLPAGQMVKAVAIQEFPRTTLGMNKIRRGELRRIVFQKVDVAGF